MGITWCSEARLEAQTDSLSSNSPPPKLFDLKALIGPRQLQSNFKLVLQSLWKEPSLEEKATYEERGESFALLKLSVKEANSAGVWRVELACKSQFTPDLLFFYLLNTKNGS